MNKSIQTWQEKKQAAKHNLIAGAIIFIIGVALFITPIVLLAQAL